MKKLPTFHHSFLYPKFWIIWIGISILYILVLLPYPIIYYIGIRIGRLTKYFLKYRVHIINKNLKLCFPNLSNKEQKKLIKKNCESIGMSILETGMAWFWSENRIKQWCKIHGVHNIRHRYNKKKGILLIGTHFLTLELGARILGILHPGIGVYRPNNNPLLNWLQIRGRLKSNKKMLDRKNIKSIITALKNGEIVWYAPDHDYGYKNSVFVPLFAVPDAASTIGTYILTKITSPIIIPFIPRRLPRAYGYELIIFPNIFDNISSQTKIETIKYINKIIEELILLAPDQYMWLHRRFKTRPNGKPYLY